MFKREQFGIVFNSIFSLVFAAALTLFVQIRNGQFTFEAFIMALVPAFAINFVLGSYIPLVKVGSAFAGIFIKNEKNPVFNLLRMFAIVFIMTFLMSLLVMFTEMGFTVVLIFALISSFPLTFLYAYIIALIVFPILLKATEALCTK
ncbi:MAG: DUF2798 domain-containing protein [Eubacterium sp.]|nr:DUF2798 domain-containing protein [Eubacterium sp.]